jgi:hypothetical protein
VTGCDPIINPELFSRLIGGGVTRCEGDEEEKEEEEEEEEEVQEEEEWKNSKAILALFYSSLD